MRVIAGVLHEAGDDDTGLRVVAARNTAGRTSPRPRSAARAQTWFHAFTTRARGASAWIAEAPDWPGGNSSRVDHPASAPSKVSSRYGFVASIRIVPSSGSPGTTSATARQGTVRSTTSAAAAASA